MYGAIIFFQESLSESILLKQVLLECFIRTDFARICRNRCIRTDVEGSEREDGTGDKRCNTYLSK